MGYPSGGGEGLVEIYGSTVPAEVLGVALEDGGACVPDGCATFVVVRAEDAFGLGASDAVRLVDMVRMHGWDGVGFGEMVWRWCCDGEAVSNVGDPSHPREA